MNKSIIVIQIIAILQVVEKFSLGN